MYLGINFFDLFHSCSGISPTSLCYRQVLAGTGVFSVCDTSTSSAEAKSVCASAARLRLSEGGCFAGLSLTQINSVTQLCNSSWEVPKG